MSVEKITNTLLNKIEEQYKDIIKKREEISILYGYKQENGRLREEVKKLKMDIEVLNAIIEDQKKALNLDSNG